MNSKGHAKARDVKLNLLVEGGGKQETQLPQCKQDCEAARGIRMLIETVKFGQAVVDMEFPSNERGFLTSTWSLEKEDIQDRQRWKKKKTKAST